VPTQNDQGYFIVGSDGGVFAFGNAPFLGSLPGENVHLDNVVGIAATTSDGGYWVVTSTGHVYNFGDALPYGSAAARSPPSPPLPMDSATGLSDPAAGSSPLAMPPSSAHCRGKGPMWTHRGRRAQCDGEGYLLFGADGGTFAFGNAAFEGSLPGINVHVHNIVGAVPTS